MGSTVSRQTSQGNNGINNIVRGQNNRLINTYNDNRQTIIIVDDVDVDDKDDGDDDEDDKDDNDNNDDDDDDDIDDNKYNHNFRNNRYNYYRNNDFFSRGPLPDEDEDEYIDDEYIDDDYTDMASSFNNMYLKNSNYDNKIKQIKATKSKKKSRKRKRKFDTKVEQLKKLKSKLLKLNKMNETIKNLATSHCKNKLFLQKNEINFNLSEIKEFVRMPIIKPHSHLPEIQEISESFSFYSITFKSMPESETLWDHIKKKDNLTEWDIRDFMSQLLLSVHFLHRHNFVHLDISPETVMVCNDKIVLYGFETMNLVNEYKTYEMANLFYGESDEKIFNYFWTLPSCANTNNRKYFNWMQLKALDIFNVGILTRFLLTATFPSSATNNKQQCPNIGLHSNPNALGAGGMARHNPSNPPPNPHNNPPNPNAAHMPNAHAAGVAPNIQVQVGTGIIIILQSVELTEVEEEAEAEVVEVEAEVEVEVELEVVVEVAAEVEAPTFRMFLISIHSSSICIIVR